MLKSLKIENFRCFPSFEMGQLGRLNLIVGTNNSGKTSILEAIQILLSLPTDRAILSEIVIGRSEYTSEDGVISLDISHLFYNHKTEESGSIRILGKDQIDKNKVITIFREATRISIVCSDEAKNISENVKLGTLIHPDGIIVVNPQTNKIWEHDRSNSLSNNQFLNSSSLTSAKMIELFERIVITPEEDLVIGALQVIEPRIKRIATVSSGKYRYEGKHSGFILQLTDEPQRVPIGSMGDGMWRMLGLALAIVNAKNGVLLVDEIDTGLHFTVMSDMWKMLWETAKRLNVQIFATFSLD